jgi:hypothetical protein
VYISGGDVTGLNALDFSTVDMSGGSVYSLRAWNSSDMNVSGGSMTYIGAYNSSTANISGGSMAYFSASDSSTANISAESVNYLQAYNSSVVDIFSAYMNYLEAYHSSTVNIFGGSMAYLSAYDSSTVILHGRNFRAANGLVLDGERVLGTGILGGEWFDGTWWAVNIAYNEPTATILTTESAPKPFCAKYPRMDFNGDCKVDFADFAIMASSWLECNLVPQSACWE